MSPSIFHLSPICILFLPNTACGVKKVSEYYQEIPQSHTHIPIHCTMRRGHRTITVTRRQEDKQSKATSSLFLIKLIAKLAMTLSTTQQNIEQTQSPTRGDWKK